MGRFKGYSEVGGYTVTYVGDGVIYCEECAKGLDKDEQDSLKDYIHWEGPSNWCDGCDKELESEYGE